MAWLGRAAGPKRVALAAAVVTCASIAGSCGSEPSSAERLQTELDELRSAFDAGDVVGVCARMTVPRCASTIRFLLERGHPTESTLRSGERTIIGVEDGQHRASAIVTFNDRVPGRLRFVERAGEWKLRDVALTPIEARSRWRSVTHNQVESFRAARTRGSRSVPCPPITKIVHSGDVAVRGGCRFRVSSAGTKVLMLTAFGDFEIARCAASHVLHIASNTATILADRIRFQGSGLCPRIRHCQDGETGLRYPWQGSKLHGRFKPPLHIQLDICVNTPMGRARGMFHFRLNRNGRSWIATPYDYPIGESSVQFSGSAKVQPGGLDLRPAEF